MYELGYGKKDRRKRKNPDLTSDSTTSWTLDDVAVEKQVKPGPSTGALTRTSGKNNEQTSTIEPSNLGSASVVTLQNIPTRATSRVLRKLSQKIAKNKKENVAVFFDQYAISIKDTRVSYLSLHDAKWDNPLFVRTVFSTHNKLDNSSDSITKWQKIEQSLGDLFKHCVNGTNSQNANILMEDALIRYDASVQSKTDFETLNDPDIKEHLKATIPTIVQHALMLPALFSRPIPILKAGENKTIYMTKRLVASFLANAFLCTLPEKENEDNNMPDINFHQMFNTSTEGNVKVEKLKCILNYFQQLGPPGQNSEKDHQVISFERRFIEDKTDWESSTTKLIKVVVEPTKRIEEAHGMLQVDFANKIVGGEVLNEGALMEEIRFAIYPELIISRLFTENLKDAEVLAITGAEQFSNYEGYAENFRYTGPSEPLPYQGDHFGRISSYVVAMDALHFSQIEIESQFEQINIDRELHKAYVAFLVPPGEPNTLVATGNWGCGVFNGDVQLKFLIQWVAASEAGRNGMQFHTFGDELLSRDIKAMQDFLIRQDVNIGDLYKAMIGYQAKISEHSCLFNYLVHSITASADSRNDE